MLIWVDTQGKQTHLTGFKGSRECLMIPVVHLIETGDRWILRTLENKEWKLMKVKGNGCADPAEFIERMISPSVSPESSPSVIMEYESTTGDSFQVWNSYE